MISFEYIAAFVLLPLPVLVYRYAPGYLSKQTAIRVPFFNALMESLDITPKSGARELQVKGVQRYSIMIAWVLLVCAAAKPMWVMEPQTIERSGRDLMLLVDLSGSMSVEDFSDAQGQPQSRLKAVKQVLTDFSMHRSGDRLGLILFGDAAFVQAPFTLDHSAWLNLLDQTEVAMAGESTHLGDAIGLGIKTFLEEDNNQSERVMIVLTDGNDTDSLVPPVDAAKVAAAYGIRIHVIAMGSPSTRGEEAVDMGIIEDIAARTKGRAFLAMSPESLTNIYQEIDQLEPKLFESFTYQQTQSLHHIPIIMMFLFHLCFMTLASVQYLRKKPMSLGGKSD